jgi:hypothetical protein
VERLLKNQEGAGSSPVIRLMKIKYVAVGYRGESDARRFYMIGVFDDGDAARHAIASGDYHAANVIQVFEGVKLRIPFFSIPNEEFANVQLEPK